MQDTARGKLDELLRSVERDEILTVLGRTGGQRTRAARRLGISRSRLYRRMDALGIDPRVATINPAPVVQPPSLEATPPEELDAVLARVERNEILAGLHDAGEKRTLAAKRLGISRSRLYRRMDSLGIHG